MGIKFAIQGLFNQAGYAVLRTDSLRAILDHSRRIEGYASFLEEKLAEIPDLPPETGRSNVAAILAEAPYIFGNIEMTDSMLRPNAASALPGILINTVPKSGTVYLYSLLQKGLQMEYWPISLGYFPRDLVDHAKLKALCSKGGRVSGQHLDPSPLNLSILQRYIKKWVVHIRDPRSVLISWMHHLERLWKIDRSFLLSIYPSPDEKYFSLGWHEKIAWNLDNFLPEVAKWMRSWLRIVDSGKYDILLTTYDDLIRDERALVSRLLVFYGIPESAFLQPDIEKSMQVHYRSGRIDEWRESLSSPQITIANRIVGKDLLERFNWSAQ